jgi:hypothetical protein
MHRNLLPADTLRFLSSKFPLWNEPCMKQFIKIEIYKTIVQIVGEKSTKQEQKARHPQINT